MPFVSLSVQALGPDTSWGSSLAYLLHRGAEFTSSRCGSFTHSMLGRLDFYRILWSLPRSVTCQRKFLVPLLRQSSSHVHGWLARDHTFMTSFGFFSVDWDRVAGCASTRSRSQFTSFDDSCKLL